MAYGALSTRRSDNQHRSTLVEFRFPTAIYIYKVNHNLTSIFTNFKIRFYKVSFDTFRVNRCSATDLNLTWQLHIKFQVKRNLNKQVSSLGRLKLIHSKPQPALILFIWRPMWVCCISILRYLDCYINILWIKSHFQIGMSQKFYKIINYERGQHLIIYLNNTYSYRKMYITQDR